MTNLHRPSRLLEPEPATMPRSVHLRLPPTRAGLLSWWSLGFLFGLFLMWLSLFLGEEFVVHRIFGLLRTLICRRRT